MLVTRSSLRDVHIGGRMHPGVRSTTREFGTLGLPIEDARDRNDERV